MDDRDKSDKFKIEFFDFINHGRGDFKRNTREFKIKNVDLILNKLKLNLVPKTDKGKTCHIK